ncbi:hypothetical protein [Methylobacterium sp. 1030]|uniref:hypothetical protein n=1 Tax=Methylobacterium sp. 1030 TaxID=3156404 RepID=UPI003393C5A8
MTEFTSRFDVQIVKNCHDGPGSNIKRGLIFTSKGTQNSVMKFRILVRQHPLNEYPLVHYGNGHIRGSLWEEIGKLKGLQMLHDSKTVPYGQPDFTFEQLMELYEPLAYETLEDQSIRRLF